MSTQSKVMLAVMFNGKFPFPPPREAWEVSLPGISLEISRESPVSQEFPIPREIPIPQEFPKIREISGPWEIPKTREFPRSKNFPPISRETGNPQEFPALGFPLNIAATKLYICFVTTRWLCQLFVMGFHGCTIYARYYACCIYCFCNLI